MKKSQLKAIIREEIEQIREYGSKSDPSVDRRIQRTENDIRDLKSDLDRQNYMRSSLDKRVSKIMDNLDLIAKKVGVKIKR